MTYILVAKWGSYGITVKEFESLKYINNFLTNRGSYYRNASRMWIAKVLESR